MHPGTEPLSVKDLNHEFSANHADILIALNITRFHCHKQAVTTIKYYDR